MQVSDIKNKETEFYLIDVREAEEYSDKIGNAINIPLGKLIRDTTKGILNLPKDKKIVCYCGSGIRGKIAIDFLKTKGFDADNLEGGFKAYKEQT